MEIRQEDRDVIDLLKRYLRPTPQFIEQKLPGSSRRLLALQDAGLVQWTRLPNDNFALMLTDTAIGRFELATEFPPHHHRNQKKIRFAMFKLCERVPKRFPLIPSDFAEQEEYQYEHIDHRSYFQEGARLAHMLVDCGKPDSSWKRLLNRWREDARKHLAIPAFAKLAEEGRFVIIAVTPYEAKARYLKRRDNQDRAIRKQVPLHVEVIPELAQL